MPIIDHWASMRMPPTPCPNCGEVLDAATTRDSGGPEPNDASVCVKCGMILLFADDLQLRFPTPQELAVMLDQRPELAKYVEVVKGMIRQRKSETKQR